MELSQTPDLSKTSNIIGLAKPITVVPNTIGKAINLRDRIEKRIESVHSQHAAKNPFWGVGSKPESASKIVQSILDRHQVLFELNEIISFVSSQKDSGVSVPGFLPGLTSYKLTLGQLRDSKIWLLPYLESIHDNVLSQMTNVTSACTQHDDRVDRDLKDEITELERQFKIKTEKAKQYNEVPPNEEDLKSDIQTAKRRADTKRSVKIDSVGVRELLGNIKTMITFIEDKVDDAIDACNARSITSEMETLERLRESALTMIKSGTVNEDTDEDSTGVSVATLTHMIKELHGSLTNAIEKIIVVSYKKGQDGKPENPDVVHGLVRLAEIFNNIKIMMEYQRARRDVMSTRFTTIHPLTSTPCSIDSMIRLGFEKTAQRSVKRGNPIISKGKRRAGRGRDGQGTRNTQTVPTWQTESFTEESLADDEHTNLFRSLSRLDTLLSSAKTQMETEKESFEQRIRDSISEKLDSRSKSGAQLKGSELEEISKAVKASDAREFFLSDDIETALLRVSDLMEKVETLQSAERKSANSILTVSVPKPIPMPWTNDSAEFNGW